MNSMGSMVLKLVYLTSDPPTFPLCFIIIHRHREGPTKCLPDQSSQSSCRMEGMFGRCQMPLPASAEAAGCLWAVVWHCFPHLPTHSYPWSLTVLPCQLSWKLTLPSFPYSTHPHFEQKQKKGPCYFKWGLTQLHKEHKIKPFSQAITLGQLKQTENSITAHYCRTWCSLSLHILWLLEKGGGKGQRAPTSVAC